MTTTATPFNSTRAKEIWSKRQIQNNISKEITYGERQYVIELHDQLINSKRLTGYSCFMDVFFMIMNDQIEKPENNNL